MALWTPSPLRVSSEVLLLRVRSKADSMALTSMAVFSVSSMTRTEILLNEFKPFFFFLKWSWDTSRSVSDTNIFPVCFFSLSYLVGKFTLDLSITAFSLFHLSKFSELTCLLISCLEISGNIIYLQPWVYPPPLCFSFIGNNYNICRWLREENKMREGGSLQRHQEH